MLTEAPKNKDIDSLFSFPFKIVDDIYLFFIIIIFFFFKSPQIFFVFFDNPLLSSDGASILLAIHVYRMPVSWLKY